MIAFTSPYVFFSGSIIVGAGVGLLVGYVRWCGQSHAAERMRELLQALVFGVFLGTLAGFALGTVLMVVIYFIMAAAGL